MIRTEFDTDSIEDLYAVVLEEDRADNALLEFGDGETAFSVEFVDFEDLRGFNVAGPLPDPPGVDQLCARVDLRVVDRDTEYVTFESEADDAAAAVSELEAIATEMDVTVADANAAELKTIETGGFVGWLVEKLPPYHR